MLSILANVTFVVLSGAILKGWTHTCIRIHINVLPDLESTLFLKEISLAQHEYMNMHLSPPQLNNNHTDSSR